MKKRTLVSIVVAVGIAGGALAVSQIDSSRFTNATNFSVLGANVDLRRVVNRAQLSTALSNAAKDMGYDINFREIYRKGYRLGSVEETSNYGSTEVDVSIGPLNGLNLNIYGDENATLDISPSGFVSDEEIKQYLSKVSDYLPQQ